jgi:hypothetical protein
MKYARKCSITGEGMNEGWCWGDGVYYSKYEKDTIGELRMDYPEHSKLTDEELIEWAVEEEGVLYWTTWEDESEHQYEEINGKLIEIK